MKKTILFALLFILSLTLLNCEKGSISVVKSEVLNAQKSRFKAMVNDDFKSLEMLLSDDLTYGHTTGLTESKNDLVHSIQSKKFDYLSFIARDTKVKIYNNVATITCIADVKLMLKTGPLNLTIKILEVHKKVNENWVLTSYQSVRFSDK